MTYDQIAEWCAEHFSIDEFDTPEEYIRNVENRFNRDKSYFPPEAKQLLINQWMAVVGIPQQQQSIDVDERMQANYEQVQQEIADKFRKFFEHYPDDNYREYTGQLPSPELTRDTEQFKKPGFFGSVARRIRGLFGR